MNNIREALRERMAKPRKTTTVELPDLGVPVILRALKYGEVKDVITADVPRYLELMLPRMLVDSEGNRLFTDDERFELEELSIEDFGTLMQAAGKLNGFTKEVVEDTIKNSQAVLSIASASA
jgi:hypothetical protein